MQDMNLDRIGDDLVEAYEDGYQRGIEESRLVNFSSQEDFTDKINKLILEGKDQGFSTKNISDKWHTFRDLYYHRMVLTYIVIKNYKHGIINNFYKTFKQIIPIIILHGIFVSCSSVN